MNEPKCEECGNYRAKMYSKNERKPDPRCVHESARLGRDADSFMTPTEARAPRHNNEGFWTLNPCQPAGFFFVPIKKV